MKLKIKSYYIITILLSFLICFTGCVTVTQLIEEKKLVEAEEYCSMLAGKAKKECHLKLANEYLKNKDYNKAGIYYRKADYKEGLLKIADIFFMMNEFGKALKYYHTAGNVALGYKKLGDVFAKNNKEDEAVKFYKKAGYTRIEILIAVGDAFYGNQNYTKALKYYANAENKERMKLCYKNLADMYAEEGDNDNAVRFYRKTGLEQIEIEAKSGSIYAYKGDKSLNRGNYEDALEFYKTSLEYYDKSGYTREAKDIIARLENIGKDAIKAEITSYSAPDKFKDYFRRGNSERLEIVEKSFGTILEYCDLKNDNKMKNNYLNASAGLYKAFTTRLLTDICPVQKRDSYYPESVSDSDIFKCKSDTAWLCIKTADNLEQISENRDPVTIDEFNRPNLYENPKLFYKKAADILYNIALEKEEKGKQENRKYFIFKLHKFFEKAAKYYEIAGDERLQKISERRAKKIEKNFH